MQIVYNNIKKSLYCCSKFAIIRPFATVCIPKYIGFNIFSKGGKQETNITVYLQGGQTQI